MMSLAALAITAPIPIAEEAVDEALEPPVPGSQL